MCVTKSAANGYISESTREEEKKCFSPKRILKNMECLYLNIWWAFAAMQTLQRNWRRKPFIGQFVLRGNLTEAVRFPHGFARLQSISGIKNWIGEGERKPNRCRKTERGMVWKMTIAGKNRRWKWWRQCIS